MRRVVLSLGVLLGLSAFAGECRAQNFSDPFFLYYGYFLPRQQALAATPTVGDNLNAATAVRQSTAVTNRANLYDPNGNFAPMDDFTAPHADRTRNDPRGGRIASGSFPTGNISGTGPAMHYSRTARYYPTLRNGHGPNRNLAVSAPRRGGFGAGGGASVPTARSQMNVGIPGPR